MRLAAACGGVWRRVAAWWAAAGGGGVRLRGVVGAAGPGRRRVVACGPWRAAAACGGVRRHGVVAAVCDTAGETGQASESR